MKQPPANLEQVVQELLRLRQPYADAARQAYLETCNRKCEKEGVPVEKPTPKKLIAVRSSDTRDGLLHITAASEAARNWVEAEAPDFGELVGVVGSPQYELRLNGVFDAGDVAAYLESYEVKA